VTAAPDRLRAWLGRRWTVTVEAVTPAPDDTTSRTRILTLAGAVRDDDRIAALTLTDRTASPAADPVAFAPEILARAGGPPLVHLAGKGRDAEDLADALRRCEAAGVGSVLLTGGDSMESRAPGLTPDDSARAPGLRHARAAASLRSLDSVDMLGLAAARAPGLTRLAVIAPPRRVRGAVSWERAAAKRAAGADAFVAQVTWDLAEREIVAGWQARLGAPVLGAVMLLTAGRLKFLAAHRIVGIDVPPALRRRVEGEGLDAARRRLALDLVALRRLGYAGAHVSGIVTPSLLAGVLDEAERLDATLGDDWRSSFGRTGSRSDS
jgi:methylenetetrahydrofolate reductase (NADPH)